MADSTNESPQGGTPSAGALLRAAREKQGLHIAALAAAIKVAPRKLDALENDRWHELPDATFTRALAQTVCRTLKIDAHPVLALLPATSALALEPVGNALNEPFNERSGHDPAGFGARAIRPMVWAALVLMVAAVAVYFMPAGLWPFAQGPSMPASAAQPLSQPEAPASSPAVPASVAVSSPATAPASGPVAAASAAVTAAPAAMSLAGETVFSAPDPVAPGASSNASAPSSLVQLRSTEASWVDARDARDVVLLSRTVQPGESVGLNGALPIRLTIGNAAATVVLFRGQPVDLAARSRDNVARVELR